MREFDLTEQGRRIARIILAAALLLLGLYVCWNFLPALAWALVLAIAIDPLHMKLRRRWPSAHGAVLPFAITMIAALVVLVPLALGISRAAHEAHEVAAWIGSARVNGVPVPDWVGQLPFGAKPAVAWWQEHLATPEGAAVQFRTLSHAGWLNHSRLIGSSLIRRSVIFTFTLIALFFLLRDRDSLVTQLRYAGEQLFGEAGERVGLQAIRSIRGTIDGLVLVGLGEGAVMAVVYMGFGVPHPLLLGSITAVAAMIPFGAALLFAIASVLLLVKGSVGGAIAVMVIGLAVVAVADHFIRPILIGGATRLPFLWVLIGILGGVEAMGLLGLFVGPATMAVLVMMWREFLEPGGEQLPLVD